MMFTISRLPLLLVPIFLTLCLIPSTHSLYFYLEADHTKCFLEELPVNTVVVGHFMAEEWDKESQKFRIQDDLGIQVVVKRYGGLDLAIHEAIQQDRPGFATMSNDHILTSTRGPSEGKFAFTSHEAGDHQICLSTDYPSSRGQAPQVRMHLDIIIGDAKPDNSNRDRAHITDLAARVRDLNAKLRDIRKEQQFQRERESEFRNLSEQTNSRAVWWSMLQLVTLVGTCVWQLRHLRGFFEDKKLR